MPRPRHLPSYPWQLVSRASCMSFQRCFMNILGNVYTFPFPPFLPKRKCTFIYCSHVAFFTRRCCGGAHCVSGHGEVPCWLLELCHGSPRGGITAHRAWGASIPTPSYVSRHVPSAVPRLGRRKEAEATGFKSREEAQGWPQCIGSRGTVWKGPQARQDAAGMATGPGLAWG